jgi:hypothetical protein
MDGAASLDWGQAALMVVDGDGADGGVDGEWIDGIVSFFPPFRNIFPLPAISQFLERFGGREPASPPFIAAAGHSRQSEVTSISSSYGTIGNRGQ